MATGLDNIIFIMQCNQIKRQVTSHVICSCAPQAFAVNIPLMIGTLYHINR